jgi:hypothetical protein
VVSPAKGAVVLGFSRPPPGPSTAASYAPVERFTCNPEGFLNAAAEGTQIKKDNFFRPAAGAG